jgi:hypothetical protein
MFQNLESAQLFFRDKADAFSYTPFCKGLYVAELICSHSAPGVPKRMLSSFAHSKISKVLRFPFRVKGGKKSMCSMGTMIACRFESCPACPVYWLEIINPMLNKQIKIRYCKRSLKPCQNRDTASRSMASSRCVPRHVTPCSTILPLQSPAIPPTCGISSEKKRCRKHRKEGKGDEKGCYTGKSKRFTFS